jgi:hypothetical protein
VAAPALAQGGGPAVRSSGIPERDTLMKMMRPMTIEFKDARLEDVVTYLAEQTGAELEPMWIDDLNPTGLDPEQTVSLSVRGVSALTVLEKVLARAVTDTFSESPPNSWQLSDLGTLQFGPKARLNTFKRLEIYDINDLLMVVPDFANAPEFDLDSVLQSAGQTGGGGGQSPFGGGNDDDSVFDEENRRSREERAEDIRKLIIELVEPEQWSDNAGTGGSIRFFQSTFIVNAPDYMHRQINGYSWWPSGHSASSAAGRRYVTLNSSAASSQINEIREVPIRVPPR